LIAKRRETIYQKEEGKKSYTNQKKALAKATVIEFMVVNIPKERFDQYVEETTQNFSRKLYNLCVDFKETFSLPDSYDLFYTC